MILAEELSKHHIYNSNNELMKVIQVYSLIYISSLKPAKLHWNATIAFLLLFATTLVKQLKETKILKL